MAADKDRAEKQRQEEIAALKNAARTPRVAEIGTPRAKRTPRRVGL